MRRGLNRNGVEVGRKKLVLDLLMRERIGDRVIAVVEPHARGRSLGDAGVEVMRKLEAVAPAADNESHCQYGEDAGLEELENCPPEGGELRSRLRLGEAARVRDWGRSGQGPLAPRTVQLRFHKYRLAANVNCFKKR